MTQNCTVMLKLLRLALGQTSADKLFSPEETAALSSSEGMRKLLLLSSTHDMTHMVGAALFTLDIPRTAAGMDSFKKAQIHAVCRYEQIRQALDCVSGMFSDLRIPFIPLKGSVIRQYYPQPEMRTSCDIDILISPEHLETVSAALTDTLGYQKVRATAHDVQFLSPAGVLLELHFTLMDDKDYPEIAVILDKVWEYAQPTVSHAFRYELTPAFAYFYHIAHMVKHFLYGGCGIRTLMDLWIYNHRCPVLNRSEALALLSEGGLQAFEETVFRISENWFTGTDYDPDQESFMQQVEEYIFRGGIYGSTENKVLLNHSAEKGASSYFLTRLFPSRQRMKYEFPVLQKYPVLLPLCYIRRWFRLLSGNTGRRVLHELKVNSTVTDSERKDMQDMLSRMALQAHIIS